ncbi:FMN-linked oxidoreductase [Karstenula rhodostoma CBS 690.94]|uniref:FMN-linked oxidoreductase n=1 Tax=Karstenula rhodostoma CBS 690.94 TaxID=1392251 RepID=A0A9P4P2T8_9PLEO|nr:FMN-linked oxidoreductase [Karstenula rhodostoma CBS 690.94]
MTAPKGSASKLFEPLKIANGEIELKHRIVHAPMTRFRATPLDPQATLEKPNRVWIPDEHQAAYYSQRATDGGLMVTEALPISLQACGVPGIPAMFHPAHVPAWRSVTDAVHAKGAYIYAQLWHEGRATMEPYSGVPSVSASSVPWHDAEARAIGLPPGFTEPPKYIDYTSETLTVAGIKDIIEDYGKAAKLAMDAGFDGVEFHCGLGYLPDQFLNSNTNLRTDDYGGNVEKRTRFPLEVMEELVKAVGASRVSIRLSPFGLLNGMYGEQRVETHAHLCEQIKRKFPKLSYISVVEPRFDQFLSFAEKEEVIRSWGMDPETVNLQWIRTIMGYTPCFSAGGWNDKNSWGVVERGDYDGFVMGRYFISNPDLVSRLRNQRELAGYDRVTFYIFPAGQRHAGYTDVPTWEEQQKEEGKGVASVEVEEIRLAA